MCHSKLRVSTSITISPNAVIQILYQKTYNIPNQYPKKFDSKDSFFLTISPEKLWPAIVNLRPDGMFDDIQVYQ